MQQPRRALTSNHLGLLHRLVRRSGLITFDGGKDIREPLAVVTDFAPDQVEEQR